MHSESYHSDVCSFTLDLLADDVAVLSAAVSRLHSG